VTVTVTDKDGGVGVGTFAVNVLNVPPAVTAPGPQMADEGTAQTFDLGRFTDPGILDNPWAVDVDWGNGSAHTTFSAAVTGSLGTQAHTYADNGTYTVTETVTDDDGASDSKTFLVAVNNVPPAPTIVDAPVSSPEGTPIHLTSTVADPSPVDTAAGFGYAWTVTRDGAPYASGTAADFTITPDDNGCYVVTLVATDKDGGTGSTVVPIAVVNVPPPAGVSGPADGVRGQTRTFTLTADDPSPVDQAAGFTFAVDWGDGTPAQAVSGPSGTQVDRVYTDTGTYTVAVTATDKDGAAGDPASQTIVIQAVEMQGSTLVAGGTTGNDVIQFSPQGGDGTIQVSINGADYGSFAGVGWIVAFGQAGDDDIQVAGGIGVPTELYGGAGNDRLKGGSGFNILDGGDGDDLLVGGSNRDIIIGGAGADRIVGNAEDDILISGDFMPGSRFGAREAALLSVMSEWTSADAYAVRVAALNDFITQRVADDQAADVITGTSGNDWFFADLSGSVQDRITDLKDAEFANDLAFINS
jgi:PKD repeat protein